MSETKSRRPLVIALASVVTCLAIGGLLLWLVPGKTTPSGPGASSTQAATKQVFEMRGQISLVNTGAFKTGGACGGKGGYDDINEGAGVVVYDAADKVIGSGRLQDGQIKSSAYNAPCVFVFSVPDVPRGEKFYQIQVSHRGKVVIQADKAETYLSDLSLGS